MNCFQNGNSSLLGRPLRAVFLCLTKKGEENERKVNGIFESEQKENHRVCAGGHCGDYRDDDGRGYAGSDCVVLGRPYRRIRMPGVL